MVLIKKNSFLLILLGLLLCCQGCGEPKKEKPVVFIIKSPLISISESDFLDELELKKAAYPYKITENPEEYNEMVISLINMLSEEALLLSAAVDLGVNVMEDEVKAAEDEFRKDYPEDGFDKMLLENAISYPLWKKRLKTNLIIDKLIDQEIRSKIEITSEELVEFYNKYNNEETQDLKKKNKEPKKTIDENELVSVLRMQKTEDVYGEWLKKLESKYLIEINKEKLRSLLIDIEKNGESENEKNN
ncbi:MAG: hypothetical protein A2277_18490 [Desulfobacterales bacterium RIFOXYA12_FULL_46_15]|nr:MAG: hypothetical protein A2097_15380 [Desulfobacula sp. GWF2_41_7]OGR28650.1 MAG: hypothetical protein A2277_18490 [Desulfobacterales bacterium RIFOXYA12_FULL_46_15]